MMALLRCNDSRYTLSKDAAQISLVFGGLGWNKPRSHIASYLSEHQRGVRIVFGAFVGGDFAGYMTIV